MINHPVMRYHGGKFRLAPWIMSFFPPHTRYVESFGGAAGVLVRKPRVHSEVYNDLDQAVVNVFRVIQNPDTRARLIESIALTPYAREEFVLAYEHSDDPVECARRTLISSHMGFGSAGATKGKTGFRSDSRRSGTAAHLWSRYPDEIQKFGARFEGVIIENITAARLIKNHDDENTLHLVDPPYLASTRNACGSKCYRHEMTESDHAELLDVLQGVEGAVVLCGYPSDLYRDLLTGWRMHTTRSRMSSHRGTELKTEVVWLNQQCMDMQKQVRLIA